MIAVEPWRIDPCRALADFEAVHPLIAAMGRWDAAEAARWGIPETDTLAAYYADTPADLMADHTAPRTAFFRALADSASDPAGCMGFVGFSDTIAEVKKFYVRPELRGRGIGRALADAVLAAMRAAGYREACLVTTRFMPEAVALYGRAGFSPCDPFEDLPAAFAPFTLFMRRML